MGSWRKARTSAPRRRYRTVVGLGLCATIAWLAISWSLAPGRSLAAGPAANVSVQLTSSSIPADGSSRIGATATVTDASGTPVIGDDIAFTSSDPGETISQPIDNENGTYSATITSSMTPGQVTVTATDDSVSVSPPSGSALLTQTGPPASVSVQPWPSSIIADGVSTSTATAIVQDAEGDLVPGQSVTLSSSDSGETIGPVMDNGNGTYTATITSSTTVGPATITATDESVSVNPPSGSATLTQTVGPVTSVSLALSPTWIVDNGVSTSTATATVTDAEGHGVSGQNVTFSSTDPGQSIGPVTDNGNGTYTATITSSTTVGTPTITATDESVTPNPPSGTAPLAQTGPPASVSVTLSPSSIVADGVSTSTATATVEDADDNPVPDQTVTFSSTDSGETIGPVTDNGTGTYTATITSSTTRGTPTITATDGAVSGTATLTQTGPPASVSVALSPTSIVADGASTSTATATVKTRRAIPPRVRL